MPGLVVPTDLSPAAAEAFAYAVRVARATGAQVHLLHVLPWPDAGPFETPGEAPTATAEEQGEEVRAHAALHALARDAGAPVTPAVRRARAVAPAIGAYADEVEADLVVAGTCGERPRAFGLGAVASEVLQTASCDVLLVPCREGAPFSHALPRRVLVPVDFSSASRPLAVAALGLARDVGAETVALVHVLEPLPHPVRWIDEALVAIVPEVRERAGEALRDLADEARTVTATASSGPAVEVYVEHGKPARTLARVAEALESDLVVVGPHAERPAFDRLLGNVAEGVVRRVSCPVWVARRSAAPADGEFVDPRSYEAEPV